LAQTEPEGHERSESKPGAKRKRDSAQPQEKAQPSRDERSARSTSPTGRSLNECKPGAKRKRDSAQPQKKAQQVKDERSECKPDRAQQVKDEEHCNVDGFEPMDRMGTTNSSGCEL